MPPVTPNTATKKTGQTRVWEDQAEMLGWLWRLKGINAAEFIGPRIAPDLDAEFELIRPIVEQIKAQETGNPVG